jgi:6-phosphogluconolactonase
MASHINQIDSNRELVVQLADRIAGNLDDALHGGGTATLALSGGSTPIRLFDRLSDYPLDWSRIIVTQVDERWVEESHRDSNARLIRRHLLRNAAVEAQFVSMKTPAASPFEAEEEAARKLAAFSGEIDVVVLGMGEDGHIASFFPRAATLQRALDRSTPDLCVAVTPPEAIHDRMTLSLAAVLRARHLYLHITGETKWQVLQKALEPGPVEELPVRGVLFNAEPPIEIFHADSD